MELHLWVFIFLVSTLYAKKYNYSCAFRFHDNEIYDLSLLEKKRAPDYTYREGEYLYVINFCGPTIKRCSGLEGGLASLWNGTSFECIKAIDSSNAEVSYLNEQNKFKGIKLVYQDYISSLNIEIACDQAFDEGVLMRANHEDSNFYFYFKSKMVCRNFAIPATDNWTGVSIFLIFFTLFGLFYVGYGIYASSKTGQYTSFADLIPQKEFVLNVMLKGKEAVNKLFGSSSS